MTNQLYSIPVCVKDWGISCEPHTPENAYAFSVPSFVRLRTPAREVIKEYDQIVD